MLQPIFLIDLSLLVILNAKYRFAPLFILVSLYVVVSHQLTVGIDFNSSSLKITVVETRAVVVVSYRVLNLQ